MTPIKGQTEWPIPGRKRILMPVSFAETFRAELDERGWSQRQAAEHLGVAPQEVNEWVNGRRFPSRQRRPSVARFLRVKVADLTEMLDAERDLSERVERLEARYDELLKKMRKLERELAR